MRCSAVFSMVKAARDKVEVMFMDFKHEGVSNDIDFKSLFAHGAWLDAQAIPILKTDDPSVVNKLVKKHIDAAAINWAWREQHVWLMSFPMTQDDCTFCDSVSHVNHANGQKSTATRTRMGLETVTLDSSSTTRAAATTSCRHGLTVMSRTLLAGAI